MRDVIEGECSGRSPPPYSYAGRGGIAMEGECSGRSPPPYSGTPLLSRVHRQERGLDGPLSRRKSILRDSQPSHRAAAGPERGRAGE